MHLAALEAAGLLGISEEDGVATLWFAERPAAPLPLRGDWMQVDDADWAAAWKDGLQPVAVGRVVITPPWLQVPQPSDAVVLVIEPGMAFGTGHHETTTGCLAALQEQPLDGRSVCDVGTGTGILAIAAARLGAAHVVAVDLDPQAVACARANVARHDVPVEVRLGSVDAAGGPFDLVLANLTTADLVLLAAPLAGLLAAGGVLVASGTSVERAREVVAALAAEGLSVQVRPGREWAVLRAWRREPAENGQGPGVMTPGP